MLLGQREPCADSGTQTEREGGFVMLGGAFSMHQQHMMKTLAVFVSPSFCMLLLDTCWRSVFIALVYALCMFLCAPTSKSVYTHLVCATAQKPIYFD